MFFFFISWVGVCKGFSFCVVMGGVILGCEMGETCFANWGFMRYNNTNLGGNVCERKSYKGSLYI